MRRTLCQVIVSLALLLGAVAAAPANDDPNVDLSEEEWGRLRVAIRERRAVPPERVIQAVRNFWSQPNLLVIVESYNEWGPGNSCGDHFRARIDYQRDSEYGGDYLVRAEDGGILSVSRTGGQTEREPRNIDVNEAQRIAEAFVRQHFPQFGRSRWWLDPEHDGGDGYQFRWQRILNQHGALAPYPIEVKVDWLTGRVFEYELLREPRIFGPTVPRLTLQQALEIARRQSPWDQAIHPIRNGRLQILVAAFGSQYLVWTFSQGGEPTDDFPGSGTAILDVDALDGSFGALAPLGGAMTARSSARLPASGPPPSRFGVREAQGSRIFAPPPEMRNGKLWLRVEVLRAFDLWVDLDRSRVEVRSGGNRFDGPALGAEWRDWTWWVPLRKTVELLGWKVEWDAAKRDAVVSRATTPRFPP